MKRGISIGTRQYLLSLVAGIITIAGSVHAAPPPERTLSYKADLVGHDNGSLSVKETFEIVTAGAEIDRTPVRYIQEDFEDGPSIGILVKKILRDGKPIAFDMEKADGFLSVYLGRRDEPLAPGTYTFQAEYELDRFTADAGGGRTTLMWKAVPPGWPTQIDRVRVHLQLPPSVLSGLAQFYGFTGFEESDDEELEITRDANNGATYDSRQPVRKGERFDVIAAWSTRFREERILRFNSEIVLNADGSADVRETIAVQALGSNIRHGIERYLLRRDRGPLGTWQYPTYEFGEAMIDGQPTPSDERIDGNGDYVVLRLGNKDEYLSVGEHVFALSYHTHDQLIPIRGGERFYWNITGAGAMNQFPVDQVTASVTLPPGAGESNIAWRAWTGNLGSIDELFQKWFDQQGRLMFLARNFEKDEALTIQVDLPEGAAARPSGASRMWKLIRDNAQLVPACGGLLAMAIYLLVAWYRHGRDPAKGIIIPIYDPPDRLSPAQIRHVMRMGYDDRCFSSDVLDLASRGLVAIGTDGSRYRLKRTDLAATGIPADEEEALARLFPKGDEVEIGDGGYQRLVSARNAIRAIVDRTCDPYFFENDSYAGYGLMISFFSLLVSVFLAPFGHKAMGLLWMMLLLPSTLVAVWLTFVAFRKWKHLLFRRVPFPRGAGLALLSTALAVCAGLLTWVLVECTASDTSLPMALVLAATAFLNYVSWDIMRAPSVLGRKLMDRVEGFRMYLETGEKEIMEHATRVGADTSTIPVRTVELFEKHLPYALALDVENKWAGKFADLVDKAHVHPGAGPGVLALSSALGVLTSGSTSLHRVLEQHVSKTSTATSSGSVRTGWRVASLVTGTVISGFAGGGRGGGGVGGW